MFILQQYVSLCVPANEKKQIRKLDYLKSYSLKLHTEFQNASSFLFTLNILNASFKHYLKEHNQAIYFV